MHTGYCNMADMEKSMEKSPEKANETSSAKKSSSPPTSPSTTKRSEASARKRFFPTEEIPRLHYSDPLANELISQEVG